MTKRTQEVPLTAAERAVDAITRGIGSVTSLVLHTLFFLGCFAAVLFGAPLETVLLALTTIVSLEAIYLALFIQMTVNRTTDSLEAVEEDIAEIVEDVAEIEKDVDEIQKDVDDIEEDIADIEKDEEEQRARDVADAQALKKIEERLTAILADLEKIRK